jgi:hypothetical protein
MSGMILTGEPVARFVSDALGFGLCPPYVALGLADEAGNIHAGAILNNFEGADIHLTAAGKGWTRAFLHALGDYVYNRLGCERMTITTERDEVVALSLRLGGMVEGRLRNHFGPGRDGVIVGVLREEWKYPKLT